MLRLAGYDIVFQEIPGEVTLALNLSGCPNGCPGCHSPHLQQDMGELLDEPLLAGLLSKYGSSVTCICFMGGDADPVGVERLARFVKAKSGLKTGWYSGRQQFPAECSWAAFDFVKLGPWVERLGGLDRATTNQVFYKIENEVITDITEYFRQFSEKRTI